MPLSAHSRRASAASRAKRLALVGAAPRRAGGQAHALELDRDVGDRERDRLAVGDRLAERLALVDVRDDVVEHGLRGAGRHGAPGLKDSIFCVISIKIFDLLWIVILD